MITKLTSIALVVSLSLFGCKKKDTEQKATPATTETPPAPAPAEPVAKPDVPAPAEPAPPAPGALASVEDYNKQGLEMLAKLVDAFKADGTNCDKLAGDLSKVMADHDGYLKAAKEFEAAHPDAKQGFEKAAEGLMKDWEKAAAPATKACADNKKLAEALSKLE